MGSWLLNAYILTQKLERVNSLLERFVLFGILGETGVFSKIPCQTIVANVYLKS